MDKHRWAHCTIFVIFFLTVLCAIPCTALAQNDPPDKQAEAGQVPQVYIYTHTGSAPVPGSVARVRRRIAQISTSEAIHRTIIPIYIILPQSGRAGTQVSGAPVAEAPEMSRDTVVSEADEQFAVSETTVQQVEKVLLETGLFATTDVLFEFDKSSLLPASEAVLDTVGEVLLRHMDLRLEIAGHTDSIGDTDYNQSLSENRAAAVKNYLLNIPGIEAVRIAACGYGEARPVASNASVTGRALNRRVEFRVLDPENPDRGC